MVFEKEGDYPVDGLNGKLAAFLAQETIPYTKETKKGVAELNLSMSIYSPRLSIPTPSGAAKDMI